MPVEKPIDANPYSGSETIGSKLADEGRLLWGAKGSIGKGFVAKIDDYRDHPMHIVTNILEGAAIGIAFAALEGTAVGRILPLAMGGAATVGLFGKPMLCVWKDAKTLTTQQQQLGSAIGTFGAESLAMLPGAMAGSEFFANRGAIAGKIGSLADKLAFDVSASGPRLVPAYATACDAPALYSPTRYFDPAASVRLEPQDVGHVTDCAVSDQVEHLTGKLEEGSNARSSKELAAPATADQTVESGDKATPEWDKGPPIKDLAAPATGKGDSWVKIYRDSFPPNESDSVYSIRQRIADGSSFLYETRGSDNRVLTFSLFDRVGTVVAENGEERPVFLNSYNATRADMRGLGLGTKHMAAALDQLMAEHPQSVIPFEIDHTGLIKLPDLETLRSGLGSGDHTFGEKNPSVSLTPEQEHTNLRRLKFYEQLAERTNQPVRVADVDYKMPDLEVPTNPPLPAHLLYFGNQQLSNETLSAVLQTIYTSEKGYGLDPSDPLIKQVTDTVAKTGIADNLKQQ